MAFRPQAYALLQATLHVVMYNYICNIVRLRAISPTLITLESRLFDNNNNNNNLIIFVSATHYSI